MISLSGFGTFEVIEGGTVINKNGTAISANFMDSNIKVNVSGGKVSAAAISDDNAVNAINTGLTRVDDEIGDKSTYKWRIVNDEAIIIFSLGNGMTFPIPWGTTVKDDSSSGCSTTGGGMLAVMLLSTLCIFRKRS